MQRYGEYAPTPFDQRGLGLPDQQDWLVVVGRNRDSDVLNKSNFHSALRELGGESDTVQIVRFGHWGPGWIELILVDPQDEQRREIAESIEASLADYPILDESDFTERETEEADRIWRDWYDANERVCYVRKHRGDFEFRSFADLRSCIRGEFFGGCASELLHG